MAKPTASVDDGGKETGVYLNDIVIEEGCVDAVADGGRYDDNFDVDGNDLGQSKGETKLTDCAKDDPVSNAGISNGSVGNMDEIGEETTLTNGPNDPVSNADANNGSVENMNEIGEETVSDVGASNGTVKNMEEIGIIFDFDGVEKKITLERNWKLCEVQ